VSSVLNAVVMYVFLIVVLRLGGRRTLGEMSTFDFILLLVISEATQQALLKDDNSLVNAWLIITTMICLDVAMSVIKSRTGRLAALLEGTPTLIVRHGRPLDKTMARCRIDRVDVLRAARAARGLERMDQIKYAVLEPDGSISIIAKAPSSGPPGRRKPRPV